VAVRFASSSRVKNDLPRYSNFWDGTTVFSPFTATGSYDALASYTVPSGGASTITFAGLPTGGQYQHLQIRGIGIGSTTDDIVMKINTNTGVKTHWLLGDGSSASGTVNNTTANGVYISNNGIVTTYPTPFVLDLLDYTNTNKYKTLKNLAGRDANGSGRVWLSSSLFDTTDAITSITLTSSFGQYSQFALYGVRG
jgi:hypothetical protein